MRHLLHNTKDAGQLFLDEDVAGVGLTWEDPQDNGYYNNMRIPDEAIEPLIEHLMKRLK